MKPSTTEPEPEPQDIAAAIVQSIVPADKLKNTAMDLADISISRLFDDGILADIPLIRTFYGLVKTAFNIKERFLIKKILLFLKESAEVPIADRERFVRAHLQDPESARRLGEMLVMVLDRLDAMDKAGMFGKVFCARVMDTLTEEDFRRLAAAIEIGFVDDLNALPSKADPGHDECDRVLQALFRTGLVHPVPGLRYKPGYVINDLGKAFVRCLNVCPSHSQHGST